MKNLLVKIEDAPEIAGEESLKATLKARIENVFKTHPGAKLPKISVSVVTETVKAKKNTSKTK